MVLWLDLMLLPLLKPDFVSESKERKEGEGGRNEHRNNTHGLLSF